MTEFEELKLKLLEEFCADPKHNLTVDGFRSTGQTVAERDAVDFVQAMNSRLVTKFRPRLYRAPQSRASEQFFWSGRKDLSPRPVTLSVEPIITVAVLWRLHNELGWPAEHLGTQSAEWGFDACAYEDPTPPSAPASSHLVIACEVKKSKAEIDVLIDCMKRFGADPNGGVGAKSPRELNALGKVKELRMLRPEFFWAVGPDRLSRAFKVQFFDAVAFNFEPIAEEILDFRKRLRIAQR